LEGQKLYTQRQSQGSFRSGRFLDIGFNYFGLYGFDALRIVRKKR